MTHESSAARNTTQAVPATAGEAADAGDAAGRVGRIAPLLLIALPFVFLGYGLAGWSRGWALGVDSSVYRGGAALLLHGHSPYDVSGLGYLRLSFTYPPPAALLFTPLAALPAQLAWAVASLDDCYACGDLRIELTLEEAGRPGAGLVAHLEVGDDVVGGPMFELGFARPVAVVQGFEKREESVALVAEIDGLLQHYFGRLSWRSPRMLRWISLVPPAMVYWRELSSRCCHRGASERIAVGSPRIA